MTDVSIRELRNDGGSVVARVLRGELITITRSGTLWPNSGRRHERRCPPRNSSRGVICPVWTMTSCNDVDAVLDPQPVRGGCLIPAWSSRCRDHGCRSPSG